MTREEQDQKLKDIIAKAREDNNFKQRLLADAPSVLREEGIEVPIDMEIRVIENTDSLVHAILPWSKTQHVLDDAALHEVIGGFKRPNTKDYDTPFFEIPK